MTSNRRNLPRGYSVYMVGQVKAADANLLGVRLGRVCIDNDIPATQVAKELGVSKQAVYAWFVGRFQPGPTLAPKVEALLDRYRSTAAV